MDYTKSKEDFQMVQETGKYTVITGASSGIGYEAAKAFAERGRNLVIIARRENNLKILQQVNFRETSGFGCCHQKHRSICAGKRISALQQFEGVRN